MLAEGEEKAIISSSIMMDQLKEQRSLRILSLVQAGAGALVAIGVSVLFALQPNLVQDWSASFIAAALGALAAIYYLTLHPFVSRRSHTTSALILTGLSAGNILVLVAGTGGLNSPYYSLLLLSIVMAGLFGARQTLIALSLTIAYYIHAYVISGFDPRFWNEHGVQLLITLAAAGLGEWVWWRSRRAHSQNEKVAVLTSNLTQEQLKSQALMSAMGEGVMVVDAAGRTQLFNRAAQELTGWDETSALGIEYNLVLKLKDGKDADITPDSDPFRIAWAKRTLEVSNNLSLTTQGGRKIPASLSVSPIYAADGTPTGAIALFRDVSTERAIERQKEEFVSTASHEMRTPVAAIEGYVSLAMNPNVATIDDRAKNYLTKAHDAIAHLGELFRDLLSVTKAEEGKLDAKMEPVNITKLITSAVDDMQFVARKKNLSLVLQTSGDGGKSIAPIYYAKANPERLREVVMNLIDNAVKFTPQGGVTVTLSGTSQEVSVAVTDTGLGIPAEDISHLFQKFYRVDSTDTRTIGGTGLGLYLCRTVIEIFGGKIWVTSKKGQGSTFTFSLPRISPEQAAAAQQPQAAAPANQAAPTIVQPQPQSATPSGAALDKA